MRTRNDLIMRGGTLLWLAMAMPVFLAAGSALRWNVGGGGAKALIIGLLLYTLGNAMMVRVMRDSGMGVAISLSAVLQLLLANAVAFTVFGERPTALQFAGIGLGVVAVALIVMPQGARQ